jgi:EmrB/QacA subfamily drug resistance transporter
VHGHGADGVHGAHGFSAPVRAVGTAGKGTGRRRWWALAVIDLCLLVVTLDNTILNVALPTIARQLRASGSQLQWMVDAYIVVFAGLLLTSGTLGDRLGRRRLMLAGLTVILAASAATALVGTSDQLIAIRGVMGLGGALLMPATLSIIANLFNERERPRAIATWAAVSAMGFVLGPVVGGALLESFDWSAVFLANVPVALIGIAGTLWLIPESRDPHPGRLDPAGAVLSIVGLGVLVYGLIEAPQTGWDAPATILRIGLGLVVLALFVAWELRSRSPMLDVRLFTRPAFGGASFAETVAHFALIGATFGLTQYLQFVWGQTPLQAGLSMLPVATGVMAGSAVASRLLPRTGPKLLVAGGMLAMALSLFLLSRLAVDSSYAALAAVLVVMSSGMGLILTPATDSIMGAVDKARAGVGSATNDTTRELGSALGIAVLGSLLASTYRDALASRLAEMPGAASLPASVTGAARDSIGSATVAAAQLGGQSGQLVLEASRQAFVSGLSAASLAGAIVVAAGAAVVLHWLPGRSAAKAAEVAGGAPATEPRAASTPSTWPEGASLQ